MTRKYICPTCKKEFEITHNSNYAINGQLFCSKKCYDEYLDKLSISDTVTEKVEVEKSLPKVEVKQEGNTPKPAVRKRKTNKSN